MLTAKQTKAVAMLFDGKTKKEISETLNISEKTVYNWRQQNEFKRALKELSDNYLVELRAMMLKNQEKLALNAKSEMVKFSATRDLLDRADLINEQAPENIVEFEDDGLIAALSANQEDLWSDET